MKKIISILVLSLCLIMTGCENEFAEQEYTSDEKISQEMDRYAKVNSLFNAVDGGYVLTVSEFDGRETLWSENAKDEQNIEINISFALSEGQAKVVHVDADGNVTTVIECLPESSTDGFVTKTLELKRGENKLKIVGYDCEDVYLEMLFE